MSEFSHFKPLPDGLAVAQRPNPESLEPLSAQENAMLAFHRKAAKAGDQGSGKSTIWAFQGPPNFALTCIGSPMLYGGIDRANVRSWRLPIFQTQEEEDEFVTYFVVYAFALNGIESVHYFGRIELAIYERRALFTC